MQIAQYISVQGSKYKVHANKNDSEACMKIYTYEGKHLKMVARA
jgi:hypothetical protein